MEQRQAGDRRFGLVLKPEAIPVLPGWIRRSTMRAGDRLFRDFTPALAARYEHRIVPGRLAATTLRFSSEPLAATGLSDTTPAASTKQRRRPPAAASLR